MSNAFERRPPSLARGKGPGLTTVRSQAARLRTLLDEVERGTSGRDEEATNAQLVEELARLGCRCIELAGALSLEVAPAALRAQRGRRGAI